MLYLPPCVYITPVSVRRRAASGGGGGALYCLSAVSSPHVRMPLTPPPLPPTHCCTLHTMQHHHPQTYEINYISQGSVDWTFFPFGPR